MGRVKIKHPRKSAASKQELLNILSAQNIFSTDIKDAHDGYAVLAPEKEIDLLCGPACTTALEAQDFTPVLPPQLKALRTVLLFRVDQHIYDNEPHDIKDEITRHNDFVQGEMTIYKFPRSKIIKITFAQATSATKACEQGLKMFQMRVSHYNIKKEEYIPIQVCYRCYKIEDHPTHLCPQDKNFTACSECASTQHTWSQCPSQTKRCLNCGEEHRTLAFKCPKRKQIIAEKKQAKSQTYAAAATSSSSQPLNQNPLPSTEENKQTFQKTISSFIHAHFVNAVSPGSFEKVLNETLKANGLAEIKIPSCPDSKPLFLNTSLHSDNNTAPSTPIRTPTPPPATPPSTTLTSNIHTAQELEEEDESDYAIPDENEKEVEESDGESADVSVDSSTSRASCTSATSQIGAQRFMRSTTRSETTTLHHDREQTVSHKKLPCSANTDQPHLNTTATPKKHSKKHRRQ